MRKVSSADSFGSNFLNYGLVSTQMGERDFKNQLAAFQPLCPLHMSLESPCMGNIQQGFLRVSLDVGTGNNAAPRCHTAPLRYY